MDITQERVSDVIREFRPYGVAIMTNEKMHDARAALASLVSDVHATGRPDLIDLVDRATAEVTDEQAGELELWLDRLKGRL